MKKLLPTLAILSLMLPSISFAAALTSQQSSSLIAVVQSSPGTPASAFVSLITAFSNITVNQATSLIAVVQAAPSVPASAFVNLLTSFTVDTAAAPAVTPVVITQPTQINQPAIQPVTPIQPTIPTTLVPSTQTNMPMVDIKVNGSDGPITIPQGISTTISWTSQGVVEPGCGITGSPSWSGNSGTSGSKNSGSLTASTTITIQCYALLGNTVVRNAVSDSVTINVVPIPLSFIQEPVVKLTLFGTTTYNYNPTQTYQLNAVTWKTNKPAKIEHYAESWMTAGGDNDFMYTCLPWDASWFYAGKTYTCNLDLISEDGSRLHWNTSFTPGG